MCFKPRTKQINKSDRDCVNLKKYYLPVTFVSTYAISYSSFTSVLYFCMNSHGAPTSNIQQEKRFNEAMPRAKPSWPMAAVAVNQVLALAGMGITIVTMPSNVCSPSVFGPKMWGTFWLPSSSTFEQSIA